MTVVRPAEEIPGIAGSAPPSASETIDCYDMLAAEYDGKEHRTTRELEQLSAIGLSESSLLQRISSEPLVVELGSGTGALSRQIIQEQRGGSLLISDPAPKMLHQATVAVAAYRGTAKILSFCASADAMLSRLDESPPDAIIAGLADPYLTSGLLKKLLRTCATYTLIFFSVPSERWAKVERQQRLRVPLDRTRFRTSSGKTLFSRSLALDPSDLASYFSNCGIEVLEHGAIEASGTDASKAPEVSWVLGQPLLAAAD